MNNFIDTLSVIVVLYKIQLEESISFQSILAANKGGHELSILIYDNSPFPQEIKDYLGLQIKYIHDFQNSGVSKAYNVGADHARHLKKKWILILDQDTSLPNRILSEYDLAIKRYSGIRLFAPILKLDSGKFFSPCRYRFKRGFPLNDMSTGIRKLKEIAPVNSGMLINIEAFFISGGYNDAVKLDFSDFQFIERFRKVYPNFCLVDVVCLQDFSDDDMSVPSQLKRFKFYCEGALQITKGGFWDWFQYYIVVFIRAIRLTFRHKRGDFLMLFVNYFFVNSFTNKKEAL